MHPLVRLSKHRCPTRADAPGQIFIGAKSPPNDHGVNRIASARIHFTSLNPVAASIQRAQSTTSVSSNIDEAIVRFFASSRTSSL